jgi:hypothetical protein
MLTSKPFGLNILQAILEGSTSLEGFREREKWLPLRAYFIPGMKLTAKSHPELAVQHISPQKIHSPQSSVVA